MDTSTALKHGINAFDAITGNPWTPTPLPIT
jgi:hypothetical protein